jgi:hypothetical protein
MIIRAKTFRKWFDANLKESASDIANHGANCGWPGITYYTDTVKLYNKFTEELWDLIEEDRESFGSKNILSFIASWNGADNVGSDDQFKNLVVWYACEKLAREYEDQKESQ